MFFLINIIENNCGFYENTRKKREFFRDLGKTAVERDRNCKTLFFVGRWNKL